MNTFFAQLPPGFLMQVLAGMRVNLQIASLALVIGLALGTPPAFARLRHGVLGAICAGIMGLMRAAPTFVVMFFLLDAIPATHLSVRQELHVVEHDDRGPLAGAVLHLLRRRERC